jgi:hypothetical protein
MKVFKCDRCGKIINPKKYSIDIFEYSIKINEDVDLCEKCFSFLKMFLENKEFLD